MVASPGMEPAQDARNTARWMYDTNFDYNPSACFRMDVPPTDKDTEEAVQLYVRRMRANGQDPIGDHGRMTAAANALGIDVATFVAAAFKMCYRPSDIPSQGHPAGEDKSACRQAFAQAYVDAARRKGCNQEPARSSEGGKYRCIWPRCRFSHKRTDEWKRHICSHRPYEVYVCDRCLDSLNVLDRGKGKPFTHFRSDKLLQHLRERHGLSNTGSLSAIIEVSRVPFPDNFEPQCAYVQPSTGEKCYHQCQSAPDVLAHWAAHFKAESGNGSQGM